MKKDKQSVDDVQRTSPLAGPDDSVLNMDDIDISSIIARQQKEYDSVMGKVENYVIKVGEHTPILHTGIPTMDICLGGGIPSQRMNYFWGMTGTGKTTLCFEIAYHNFLRNAYTGNSEKWRYVFVDAEEGQSKNWLNRIKINFPYKYDIPSTIEDLEPYLTDLKKEFPKQELFVIWDSVSTTQPKMITGRADIARAVSTLLNHISLTELGITFLVINQQREKQEQYAPPVPPGGHFLRHKSHLTMHAPSYAKSEFWSDKKNGRSILWKTQKTRDSFNDVEFRLEMTYFSGFDAILSFIYNLHKDLKILKKRSDKYTLGVDEELSFKSGDKDSKQEYTVDFKTLADFDVPTKSIEGFVDLYNFFMDIESLPYWKFGLRYYAYQIFRPYFVYNDDKFTPFFESLITEIENYYFKNWNLFVKTLPTKLEIN